MPRLYAATPRPITLASGRPVQPGEHIDAALLTRIPAPGSDPDDETPKLVVCAHDQRLLDHDQLLPSDDEPIVIPPPVDDQHLLPVDRQRRGRRAAETPKD